VNSSAKFLVSVSCATLLASACTPQLGGEEGNLSLSYEQGPIAEAVGSSPLAVGAKLDYSVSRRLETSQKLSFDSATSSADSVVAVSSVQGGLMTLEALSEGQASIDVEATDGGELLHDTFVVEARVVDSLEIAHPCAPGDEAVYLVDHDVRLHYTMRAESTVAVGYGYYPVEFQPADAATLGATTLNGLLPIHTGSTPGEVTIASTVSDDAFAITLIEAADITGLTIFEEDFLNETTLPVEAGKVMTLHVLPLVDGSTPVCQSAVELEIDVATPDICEVAYGPSANEADNLFHLYETNVLEVTGLAAGACEFSVTLPAAADGAGVSLTHSMEVLEESDGGGSGDD
jgi:hypothetical protein